MMTLQFHEFIQGFLRIYLQASITLQIKRAFWQDECIVN